MVSQQFENFVVVGTQRTGSSLLAEQLSLHSEIACGWEWTETLAPWRKVPAMESALAGNFKQLPEAELQHIQSQIAAQTRSLGFRRLFGASNKWLLHPRFSAKLMWDRFSSHLHWFRSHPNVAIIHIVRTDDVAWLRSKYASKSTGTYVGKEYPQDLQVTIPINEAIARLTSKSWVDGQLASLGHSNPYLRVNYECFVEAQDQHLDRCFDLLGCSRRQMKTGSGELRKQAKRPDHEYIANFEELNSALLAHGFQGQQ